MLGSDYRSSRGFHIAIASHFTTTWIIREAPGCSGSRSRSRS
jgi:hypothetical protein